MVNQIQIAMIIISIKGAAATIAAAAVKIRTDEGSCQPPRMWPVRNIPSPYDPACWFLPKVPLHQ